MARIVTDNEEFFKFSKDDQYNNILLLTEPYLLHPENYIEAAAGNWKYVLSSHADFIKRYDNWLYYPLGGCHVPEDDRIIHQKTKDVSMFVSNKNTMPGHKLRHKLLYELKYTGVDFYGQGAENYVSNKADGLRDYRFSIVIENSRESGYFTEKIVDCFLTGTIPIYWGDPDIGRHFMAGGFYPWYDDMGKLMELLATISENGEEIYEGCRYMLGRNFAEAREYTDHMAWIKKKYKRLFE